VSLNRDGDSWVLDIDDDGPGIYDELRDVIFDPYFTTKHSGTGLGLAIVKKAIVEHGGSIENSVGNLGGAAFRVRLPIPGASPNESRIDVAQAGSSARTIGTQHEQ
jgi:C4-dicarboxylate-specific signal transduction histidine kinase